MTDAFERIVAAGSTDPRGLYESHYLKATSPDGQRALWIKHNVLRRSFRADVRSGASGPQHIAEVWAVRFQRGRAPEVAKREIPLAEVRLDGTAIAFDCGSVSLRADRARGEVADVKWDLRMRGGQAPLWHYPYDRLYTGAFPKKKILTPAPNLAYDGELVVGGEAWSLAGWRGMRGHNWGLEHAYTYAYGSCSQWDDGDPDRSADGFTAKIRLAGRTSPWLSAVVGHGPEVRKNGLRHWLARASVGPDHWRVGWARTREAVSLELRADPKEYAGLRYEHPSGVVSYCYNSKLARVAYTVGGRTWTSTAGELEVLFPEPLAGVPLHPAEGWTQADGDYRS